MSFELNSPFEPAGDQPKAIKQLIKGLSESQKQILMGVTGSGKTFTLANVIQTLNKPTLVLAHNKTLAAQLFDEFKEFFPNNAVEYFISYYDYYQPEAYIPSRDIYIEKEADINEEIERFRHRATRSLLLRKDVIIVASVSCIYGLGIPEEYSRGILSLKIGDIMPRNTLLRKLEKIQYQRNDFELKQGRYRVKGETIDLLPSWDERYLRLVFFGDELDDILILHPVTNEIIDRLSNIDIFPATHYLVSDQMSTAIKSIKTELNQQIETLSKEKKIVEAQRLESRTHYDIEMMEEMGYCKGIENYSRHLSQRKEGEPGGVLIDFFPDDFLTIIDESHVTLPQVRGMFHGDQSRKSHLIDYGFRLPSAKDNRPLTYEEFENKIGDCIYVSATPGDQELQLCRKQGPLSQKGKFSAFHLVEQIVRPTGLLDPEIILKPSKNQIQDLRDEIQIRSKRNERTLVSTITKKLAEDLSEYLQSQQIKTQYLHSDISALDRVKILHQLRLGTYDVLVGVNLLREGLDLPEVSLVAILDADKEGFLRNERSLIQLMGRAARNKNGQVRLYADQQTNSMTLAINETNRRRKRQIDHNITHNITPKSIQKELPKLNPTLSIPKLPDPKAIQNQPSKLPDIIQTLTRDMKTAAKDLNFELAAVLRDQIEELKQRLDSPQSTPTQK